MRTRRAIVWFRNDLRLHDNEALCEALSAADEILPVYVFDQRLFKGTTPYGFRKCGKYRCKFIIESVENLRDQLQQRYGMDLVVRCGLAEEEIFKLAREIRTSWVFCNRERTGEEVAVQDALEKKLWSIGQELRFSRGKMLYYTADLPFPVTHTPDIFSQFRKETEQIVQVRKPLPLPDVIRPVAREIDPGDIPALSDFDHENFEWDERAAIHYTGGESAGLRRLRSWLWKKKSVLDYRESRDELMGPDYSSRLGAWLSQGCLSPKKIYWELKKFEQDYGANESTHRFFLELLWRDFFRLMVKKYGNRYFLPEGLSADGDGDWSGDWEKFNSWARGSTGMPFVDANMREINETGYMSNRGRQNVASYLVHDLKVNWIMGAEYFESLLVDYDPCSNYGNWAYIAGVGNDPRPERHFNVVSQARRYDPRAAYIHRWLPELSELSGEHVFNPSETPRYILEEAGIVLGKDYPWSAGSSTVKEG